VQLEYGRPEIAGMQLPDADETLASFPFSVGLAFHVEGIDRSTPITAEKNERSMR
jgi:hypothetical protein